MGYNIGSLQGRSPNLPNFQGGTYSTFGGPQRPTVPFQPPAPQQLTNAPGPTQPAGPRMGIQPILGNQMGNPQERMARFLEAQR